MAKTFFYPVTSSALRPSTTEDPGRASVRGCCVRPPQLRISLRHFGAQIRSRTFAKVDFAEMPWSHLQAKCGRELQNFKHIILLVIENGNMTTVTLAEALGISTKAVEKHLSKLKSEGAISRIGPDKGGHWEVH